MFYKYILAITWIRFDPRALRSGKRVALFGLALSARGGELGVIVERDDRECSWWKGTTRIPT
jgi:hypothetical protein